VTVIEKWSPDASRPYANLLPIVEALVRSGNETREGGFVSDPGGFRCVMLRPLDLDYVTANFELPPNISLSRDFDSIHDRLSWSIIQGPGH
jgi:hypothetical protein